MNDDTRRKLSALTSAFYQAHASSFSATRQQPWQGWSQLAQLMRATVNLSCQTSFSVLDLACGNLRFEQYLSHEFPHLHIEVEAWDNCAALTQQTALPANASHPLLHTSLREIDILEALFSQRTPRPHQTVDLAVSFGFFHHIPGREARLCAAKLLWDALAPQGLVAISFWQPMNDPALRRRAAQAEDAARSSGAVELSMLEPGDHLLGWQGDYTHLRYCHHFEEDEIDWLAHHLIAWGGSELARFSADGKSAMLNRYLVMQR